MKKNTVVFLFALCPLVPVSARFAYALILALAMCWYFLSGLVFRELARRLEIGAAGLTVELVTLAGSATLYYLCLAFFSPVLSVSLGLYCFVAAFSYLLLLGIDTFISSDTASVPLIPFIPLLVLFSAFREILGYGTLSLPVSSGLLVIPVLPNFSVYGLGFWGTTGGAFILLAFVAWAAKYYQRRAAAFRRNM